MNARETVAQLIRRLAMVGVAEQDPDPLRAQKATLTIAAGCDHSRDPHRHAPRAGDCRSHRQRRLANKCAFERRGEIDVKGKGRLVTHLLVGNLCAATRG